MRKVWLERPLCTARAGVSLHCPAVAGKKITLEVQTRTQHGSREVKRLRRTGVIPGVVYGGDGAPRSIAVDERVLRAALTGEQGRHAILHVSIDGATSVPSILKDWQSDPVRTKLRHIDLLQIAMDKPIVGTVGVTLVGESPGAKLGGALNHMLHQVRVQAIPAELPDHVMLDISGLGVGDALRVSDITASKGATVLDDPEAIVVAVAATRLTAGADWRGGDESDEGSEAAAAPDATE